MQSKNSYLDLPVLKEKEITLALKREDLLHPLISGNKYRKLKYNLQEAQNLHLRTLITFGGAYSNHIAALSYAGMEKGLSTVGIIRGEELMDKWQDNPTLAMAHQNGMVLKFISRAAYRKKTDLDFLLTLEEEYGPFYLVPEGGTNSLAIKGCEEILTQADEDFDMVCTCVGTGGTMAGLINSSRPHQQVMGFAALKGEFLEEEITKMTTEKHWKLISGYHFNGYGKVTGELVHFINKFKRTTGIPLDPVYTGKMLYGLLDMIKNDNFAKGTKILAIHTGGLQGIAGMNLRLKKKKLPLLHI